MGVLKHQFLYDINAPERTLEHRDLILRKSFLKSIYIEWYNGFINQFHLLPEGKIIELGSGGGFLKQLAPSVICTDILELPQNDMTFSALEMPFENNEVSAILMVDTFHHIPDIERFLKESIRVLKNNGRIMMVEPANSLWGRFIYQNFHHEPFYPKGGWKIESDGPMSGANGALPWIVFERDVQKFANLFAELQIVSITYHSPFKYLISGGVSYKQLLPGSLYPLVNNVDKFLSKISKQFSMFANIIIEKK